MKTSNLLVATFLGAFLISSASLAAAMKVTARDYMCADLQTLLAEQSELKIRAHLIGRYHVVATPQQCSNEKISNAAEFRTLDSNRCELGFTCEFQNIGEGSP